MNTTDTDGPITTLRRLVDAIGTAMLTTIGDNGVLESRPMATQEVDSDGALWFFASRRSYLAEALDRNPQVNVAYADLHSHRYVSVSGEAAVVDDRAQRHGRWRSAFATWFPAGVDDPDLILLRVHIEHADFWEEPAGVVRRLAGFAKALLTGDHEQSGTHGRLVL